MNRVRLLSEHVANQIAAGEVIERPASVVKELVENALDAGSRSIRVDIQAGGRSLIRVTDDGCGMSRDDALLCLERHATSKIQKAEDLTHIATMGFRGEALPSIASVTRFTLTTREADGNSPEGTQVVISGGKIIEVKAAGSAPGTTIEARQLFFNLPARRKFLRAEETESSHIQHYLTLAALSHPQVGFTFFKDGRLVWQLPAVPGSPGASSQIDALGQRLRALYGSEPKMLTVDFTGTLPAMAGADEHGSAVPEAKLRVWGLIGAPGVSRSTRDDQHIFVNKRPVENKGLNFALIEGYHTSLMKGRYPVCCLFIEIDPGLVDVNIHPAKREVKFHQEYNVRRIVAEAVRQGLLQFHGRQQQVASPNSSADPMVPGASNLQSRSAPTPTLPAPKGMQTSRTTVSPVTSTAAPPASLSPTATAPALPGFDPVKQEAERPASSSQATLKMGFSPVTGAAPATSPSQSPPLTAPVALLDVPLKLIGVVGRLYVLFESDRGLVLLDQHAAHERILFEQMLERLERAERAPCQKLLLPQTVELPPRDAVFLRDNLEVLSLLGVGLSDFGERTFLLDALPPFVKAAEPRQFVLELVDQLKAVGQSINKLRLGEDVVAKTVCRHAVKANDPLAGPELEKLVAQLRLCAMPYTCPHGRPTLIEMSYRELEKKFGRVQ